MKKEIDISWDVGDKVFLFYGRRVRRARIREVVITLAKGYSKPRLTYTLEILSDQKTKEERIETTYTTSKIEEIFECKKDAIFSWLKANEVIPQEILQDFFHEEKEG
jgi:hypothetical protein